EAFARGLKSFADSGVGDDRKSALQSSEVERLAGGNERNRPLRDLRSECCHRNMGLAAEEKVAMNFVGADRDVSRDAYFGHAREFIATKNSSDRVVGIAQKKKTSVRSNGGCKHVPVDRVCSVFLSRQQSIAAHQM